MQIPDFTSYSADHEESTHLNFEKKERVEAQRNLLTYFYMVNDEWVCKELPSEISQLKIGSNPYKCEVQVDNPEVADIQVVLRRVGKTWYIIESGKNDLMKVNGFKKRQAHLKGKGSVVIQVGELVVIFTVNSRSAKDSSEVAPIYDENTPLEEGEFTLSVKDKTVVHNSFDELCLIGSSPYCDYFVEGEAFAALITHFGKRLFVGSMLSQERVTVARDGVAVDENTSLAPGSVITVGDVEMTFRLSKDLRFSQGFNFVPDSKEQYMMLLELDSYGNQCQSYALPKSGRSILIGRDHQKCKISLTGSKKISRQHIQALIYDKSILIIDNRTTNGTFINGEKVRKKLAHPGDLIRMANLTFILCFVG